MKRKEDFITKEIHWLNDANYILEVEGTESIPNILPGNFAEILINDTPNIFLRRPFSIQDVNQTKNTLSFYIKICGQGTLRLSKLLPGQKINIIYPLGNSFNTDQYGKVLVVAGGSGIAPLMLLARELKKQNNEISFVIGGKTQKDILLTDEFKKFGEVHITTEDGSKGEKGLVTEHPIFMSDEFPYDKIYTCGPEPMMKTIAKFARDYNTDCEVSLEKLMACGFGACLCCVVETTEGYKCSCTEGPVFNTKELKW